jgi:hypothetical protein
MQDRPNSYFPGVGFAFQSETSVTIGDADPLSYSLTIVPGDVVMIIQMQDARIDSTNGPDYGNLINSNAGHYEFNIIQGVDALVPGYSITVQVPLQHTYESNGIAGSLKAFQVVVVPSCSNITLSDDIFCAPWNGQTGGIVAVQAIEDFDLQSNNIYCNSGFRGGMNFRVTTPPVSVLDYRSISSAGGAYKGEGIAGTPALSRNAFGRIFTFLNKFLQFNKIIIIF